MAYKVKSCEGLKKILLSELKAWDKDMIYITQTGNGTIKIFYTVKNGENKMYTYIINKPTLYCITDEDIANVINDIIFSAQDRETYLYYSRWGIKPEDIRKVKTEK